MVLMHDTSAVLDIANPIDPIDRSIRILNQVVAMERDEALRRPRWCGRSKSRDLLLKTWRQNIYTKHNRTARVRVLVTCGSTLHLNHLEMSCGIAHN